MRSVSDTPKVMLPVQGKPILEHQIEWLKKHGFNDIFLCLGYRADKIQEYFGDGSRWGVRLAYRVETEPRGTAGAIADLGPLIEDDLLVVYGDLFLEMDCGKLLEFHAGHDGLATLVVRETDHPEDSDLVEADGADRVLRVARRKAGNISGNLGCAAVWVVRKALLERVPEDRPSDFARDIFPAAVAGGDKLMAYRTDEPVMDIGTPARYEAFLKTHGPA